MQRGAARGVRALGGWVGVVGLCAGLFALRALQASATEGGGGGSEEGGAGRGTRPRAGAQEQRGWVGGRGGWGGREVGCASKAHGGALGGGRARGGAVKPPCQAPLDWCQRRSVVHVQSVVDQLGLHAWVGGWVQWVGEWVSVWVGEGAHARSGPAPQSAHTSARMQAHAHERTSACTHSLTRKHAHAQAHA